MTASVPNGFSAEDLQAMLDSAPKEDEVHAPEAPLSDEDAIDAAADDALNSVKNPGPLVHKVMAMKVIVRMIEWHTSYGEALIKDGETEMAVSWLRDAGKFQACLALLQGITVGNDDFTCLSE